MKKLLLCLFMVSISSNLFAGDKTINCKEDGQDSVRIFIKQSWLGSLKDITVEDRIRDISESDDQDYQLNEGPDDSYFSSLSLKAWKDGNEYVYELEDIYEILKSKSTSGTIPLLVTINNEEQFTLDCKVRR